MSADREWRRRCPRDHCRYSVFTTARECPSCLIPTEPLPRPEPRLPADVRPVPPPRPAQRLEVDS